MKLNKFAITTSLLLAMGFTAPSFAESAATTAVDAVKEVATDVMEKAVTEATTATDAVETAVTEDVTATTEAAADCATQADVDAMSDADKAALTTPICETGAEAAPADPEAPVAK